MGFSICCYPDSSLHSPLCSLREKTAAEERAKEACLIAQFLQKCAEDDAKEALARKARDEAMLVR